MRQGLRGRLLLSVIAGILLVLVALTVAFNLVLGARLDADANGLLQARLSGQLSSLRVRDSRIALPEAPDQGSPDTLVWVFAGQRVLERPRAAPRLQAAAARLAARAPATADIAGTRLSSAPVVQSGRRYGAATAAISLVPYDQTRRTALIGSCALALAVLLVVAACAGRLISRALAPVARMTLQAADWSEHDLDRRFSLGPPRDELTQLAATLDELLDRLAASLRHEQRLSAELSHELRTPLASIAAEAQYALRHTQPTEAGAVALEQIVRGAAQMERTLDTLIAAARAQLDPARGRSDAAAGAEAARLGCLGAASERGVEVSVVAPADPAYVRVETDLVERILAPLLENAVRYASHTVKVTIQREAGAVTLAVIDDGPGLGADDQEDVFLPGRRGPVVTSTRSSAGAGLGLALSRRLARSAGGDVIASELSSGGHFMARLPSA